MPKTQLFGNKRNRRLCGVYS